MDRSAGSELLSMMALVAGVVAAVILVFFGIGYLFGRLFPVSSEPFKRPFQAHTGFVRPTAK